MIRRFEEKSIACLVASLFPHPIYVVCIERRVLMAAYVMSHTHSAGFIRLLRHILLIESSGMLERKRKKECRDHRSHWIFEVCRSYAIDNCLLFASWRHITWHYIDVYTPLKYPRGCLMHEFYSTCRWHLICVTISLCFIVVSGSCLICMSLSWQWLF